MQGRWWERLRERSKTAAGSKRRRRKRRERNRRWVWNARCTQIARRGSEAAGWKTKRIGDPPSGTYDRRQEWEGAEGVALALALGRTAPERHLSRAPLNGARLRSFQMENAHGTALVCVRGSGGSQEGSCDGAERRLGFTGAGGVRSNTRSRDELEHSKGQVKRAQASGRVSEELPRKWCGKKGAPEKKVPRDWRREAGERKKETAHTRRVCAEETAQRRAHGGA